MSDSNDKKRRRRREPDPLKVNLTFTVRFGDAEDEQVTLLDDREMLMVGSIFRYRDRMARFLVTGLFRAAMLQPKVAAKLLPGLKQLRAKQKD